MNRSSSVTIDGAFGVFGAMAQMPVVAYFASISCAVSSRGCSCCGTRIASKTAPSSSLSVGSSAATVVSAVFSGGACGTMESSRLSTCCLTTGSGGAEAVCVVSRLPKSRESANPSSRKTDAQAATPAPHYTRCPRILRRSKVQDLSPAVTRDDGGPPWVRVSYVQAHDWEGSH